MLLIIDYNAGNIRSVINAFRYIGAEIEVGNRISQLETAQGLILPGVGASKYAMEQLKDISEPLCRIVRAGKPLLGICLGYQLLFDQSFEMGQTRCLGLIAGDVVPIPPAPGRVVPHMGWNYVQADEKMRLMEGLYPGRHFAFVHSYYAQVKDQSAKVATVEYDGVMMSAAVEKDNIFGCQFHPEKSGTDGLQVLRNFVKICQEASKC